MLKCAVREIVEVVNQTIQLLSFSYERPMEWVSGLSVILMLNGLLVPVPFVMMRLAPGWDKAAKLILAWTDIAFDSGCLIITISHSQQSEFADENTWWIATFGVIVPIVSIAWRSTRLAAAKETIKQSSGHRIALVFSVMTALFSIVSGGIFLRMAIDGDQACRGLLGDTLWEGSSPKIVLVKDGVGRLHGGCNFTAIKKISVSDDGAAPMVRLPPLCRACRNWRASCCWVTILPVMVCLWLCLTALPCRN